MTTLDVCAALRAECKKRQKPYAGVMLSSLFFNTLARIETGKPHPPKPATIKEFFEKLGYKGEYNSWEKQEKKEAASV